MNKVYYLRGLSLASHALSGFPVFNLPKTHFHDNHGGGHSLQTIVYNDRYDSNDRCILLT
ncbi:hypothetical protein GF130_18020 [Escherichia coli]|nr:hypothetical protein [Escherichia coli]